LNEERTVLEEASDGTEFVMWASRGFPCVRISNVFSLPMIVSRACEEIERRRTQPPAARAHLEKRGNFLLLDEPTNDLDLPTLRVLEEALIAFPGVVCVCQP